MSINHNELQDKYIEELKKEIACLKDNANKCVKMFLSKQIATVMLGVMMTLIATLFAYSINAVNHLDNKVEKSSIQFSSIQAQLAGIQADLIWIKRELR